VPRKDALREHAVHTTMEKLSKLLIDKSQSIKIVSDSLSLEIPN
jgi:hypothetical protein